MLKTRRLVRVNIAVQCFVVYINSCFLWFGDLIQNKISHMMWHFSTDRHGFNARNAINNNVLTGHLSSSFLLQFRNFFDWKPRIKIVTTANRIRSTILRFNNVYIHFPQKASNCCVHLWLWTKRTEVVYRDRQSCMIRQGQILNTIRHFPQGNGLYPFILRAESSVAP